MIDFLARHADTFAYLAGVAWVLGMVALGIFFAGVGTFGPINDAISIFQFLFLVPVALALHRMLGPQSPALSLGAAIVGIAAMLIVAVLQLLLVWGVVRFEQTIQWILVLGGIVGIWWLVTPTLSLSPVLVGHGPAQGALPAGLAWVGIIAGAGAVVAMVGWLVGGQMHPLTLAGFVPFTIAVPVWAFWMGRVLARANLV